MVPLVEFLLKKSSKISLLIVLSPRIFALGSLLSAVSLPFDAEQRLEDMDVMQNCAMVVLCDGSAR
ncbi:hypothetical protein RvVAR031_23380 [Agrobacterium vitis]|nr:hypothetical protein RvVAR031_23380 [Agrobacterium vitis]